MGFRWYERAGALLLLMPLPARDTTSVLTRIEVENRAIIGVALCALVAWKALNAATLCGPPIASMQQVFSWSTSSRLSSGAPAWAGCVKLGPISKCDYDAHYGLQVFDIVSRRLAHCLVGPTLCSSEPRLLFS